MREDEDGVRDVSITVRVGVAAQEHDFRSLWDNLDRTDEYGVPVEEGARKSRGTGEKSGCDGNAGQSSTGYRMIQLEDMCYVYAGNFWILWL